jgi:hypothetical protein
MNAPRTVFRVADSSFRRSGSRGGVESPNISHATDERGERTLCGRDARRWTQNDWHQMGPDCLTCRKKWDALGGAGQENDQ